MIDLAIGMTLAVVVYLLGVWNGRTVERRRTAVSPLLRAPFDDELKEHLARRDARVISNDQFRYMQTLARSGGIYETREAPRDRLIFAHPDTLARLTREAGPEMIRAFQEWGDRHSRYTSPFLLTCTHEWRCVDDASGTFPGSPHKCTRSVMTHGPKCVCRCGATAAYVEQPDGTIDKTFEEPKGDGS